MKPKSKIVSFFNTLFVDLHDFGLTKKIEGVIEKMNITEKFIFYTLSLILTISSIALVLKVNDSFLVEVPSFGGKFSEGLVGSPRFINPVLAISDTDKDLSRIIYSGLLKIGKESTPELDLAESYTVNDDGTVYDFKIKNKAYFHDGKEVTADDVAFTIEKVLDPVVKSPKKANWDGVTVEKISNKEIKFTLKKPYAPFLQALTLGILPKHIWDKVTAEEFPFSQYNIDPIGAGPYKIEKISKNSSGIPTTITLSVWKKYTIGRAKINSITFNFYQNETDLLKALNDGSIENTAGLRSAYLSKIQNKNVSVSNVSLPRIFGIFLNQNNAPIFANKEVRQALEIATPKKKIVDEVLLGFGKVIDGPTPSYVESDTESALGNPEKAKALLASAGWQANKNGILEKKTKKGTTTFSFSISTSDAPELKKTAEILKEAWGKIGADVSIKVFEAGDLSQNVIRSRKYDALLFGEMVGENSDLYPFWHSSERNDPGLNISLYTNITVDKLLEEIQKEKEAEIRKTKKEQVVSEIKKDIPAIFLFSPDFSYVKSPKIKNVVLKDVSSLNERFIYINNWFIETNKVWKIFSN